MDGPWIESRWRTRFSASVQTGPGAHTVSCTMRTGSFPGVKTGQGVTLTPHPLLVPWSWKGRAIPLLPLWVVQPVQSLSACTRVHFTYFLPSIILPNFSTFIFFTFLNSCSWVGLFSCGAVFSKRLIFHPLDDRHSTFEEWQLTRDKINLYELLRTWRWRQNHPPKRLYPLITTNRLSTQNTPSTDRSEKLNSYCLNLIIKLISNYCLSLCDSSVYVTSVYDVLTHLNWISMCHTLYVLSYSWIFHG